jgi:hypothetical protein
VRYFSSISEIEHDYGLMARPAVRAGNGRADRGWRLPEREGNRDTRAARVLAKDDSIDVKTLADRAVMSETTAARCLEAWDACVAALIKVERLPDPSKKKTPAKTKPAPAAKPAATETTATPPAAEPVGTAEAI